MFGFLDFCYVVSLCLLFGTWWALIHRWLQRNHNGPKTWPLIGCIPEQALNFDILHDWLLGYFRSTLTFSVPMLFINNTFTSDPANVHHILKANFDNYPKGELIHERFAEVLGDGIFNVDGQKWVQQRKVAIGEFSSAKLRDYSVDAFRLHALKLMRVLANAAGQHDIVDMQDMFMRLTLDSTCKIGFGMDVGSLSPELPNVPFASAFDESNRLVVRRYVDFFWKVKRALNIGAEAKLCKCIRIVDDFIYNVIHVRRKELGVGKFTQQERVDLLSRFMSLCNEDDRPYSDKQLRDVIINFIIAGRDTTAVTLTWLFSMLCKHPRVVKTILDEVETVLKEQAISKAGVASAQSPRYNQEYLAGCLGFERDDLWRRNVVEFAQLLSYQALNRMHYLHATISEALRLFPAVPLESKIAVADDIFPDGTKIKAGNFVSYVPYSMGRLEKIWGPDAAEFKPERWLKGGVFQPESSFKFTAFQAGPRMCLGKDSAYLQMKMTTVLLLRFFQFKLVEGPPSKYSMMVVLSMAQGLKASVSLR